MRLFQLVRGPINVIGPIRRPFRISGKGMQLRSPLRNKGSRVGVRLRNPVSIRGPRLF